MKSNTRIYNRFTGYTTEDCDCKYCLYYAKKEKCCTLPECCCLGERQQAYEQEHGGKMGAVMKGAADAGRY